MSAVMRFWLGAALAFCILAAAAFWALSAWNLSHHTALVADRLLLLAELRRGALEDYFDTARTELRFWSINPEIQQAQQDLLVQWTGPDIAAEVSRLYIDDNPHPAGRYRQLADAGDGSAYSALHARLHDRARLFVTERGYYDFFLISPDGDILYTVEKESDFATNLRSGPWRDSGLADVFERAMAGAQAQVIATSDMAAYGPSSGAPAIFMATALRDAQGQDLGVIAFQLPTNRILSIMNYTSGMGETGETYLVGGDLLMRSNSRFTGHSTVLTQRVDSPTVRAALEGRIERGYVDDYRGIEVMSVALPMQVGDSGWAVMAEMDRAEVEGWAAAERPAFAAPLAFIYGLSLWSVWYWRNRRLRDEDDPLQALAGGDLGDSGSDLSGFDS